MKKGDVIKILHTRNALFVGKPAIVDEVKPWGVQAYLNMEGGGEAYIRLANGEFELALKGAEYHG